MEYRKCQNKQQHTNTAETKVLRGMTFKHQAFKIAQENAEVVIHR